MYARSDPAIDTIRCTYHLGTTEKSPHNHIPFDYQRKLVYNDILDVVGNTPMVRLNRIPQQEGVNCEILAKCEFLNPGGSLKDRIGVRMLHEAELSGRVKKGDTLIEATSGNTGIGLAMAAAVRGYKMIITLPEKMSTEKTDVLQALGAKIYRTPTEAAFDDYDSHISLAIRLKDSIPDSHILDQYINPGNALAHYDATGEEIVHQTGGKADYVFIGAGTGGTITGIARKIKEKMPNCVVVGVDPHGSLLAQPQSLNTRQDSYLMEGIGYDFIPRVLDRKPVDVWLKVDDTAALPMARRLIREEGMFCGGSSGAVLASALTYLKENNIQNKRVVVILADNLRNYITKLVQREWMADKGFINPLELSQPGHRLAGRPLDDFGLTPVQYFDATLTVGAAWALFEGDNAPAGIPIIKDDKVFAVVWQSKVMEYFNTKQLKTSDPITRVWSKDYSSHKWESLDGAALEQLLVRRPAVFIEKHDANGKLTGVFIATPAHLLKQLKPFLGE